MARGFGARESGFSSIALSPFDEARTRKLENEGMTRSDAQSVVEAENKDAVDSRKELRAAVGRVLMDTPSISSTSLLDKSDKLLSALAEGDLKKAAEHHAELNEFIRSAADDLTRVELAPVIGLVNASNKALEAQTKVGALNPVKPSASKPAETKAPKVKKEKAPMSQEAVDLSAKVKDMSISQLAQIARRNWRETSTKGVNYAARPYLDAMGSMDKISDNFGMDTGAQMVAYFLGNATSWKGDIAKVIKAELNRRLKD